MGIKSKTVIIAVVIVIALIGALISVRLFSNEDLWIKDSKGIWVKHGNPSQTPDYVLKQQNAIDCGKILYASVKSLSVELNSKCLGNCEDYAVDLVNVPRNADDEKSENQCLSFTNGEMKNFIELDNNGNIVRVVEG